MTSLGISPLWHHSVIVIYDVTSCQPSVTSLCISPLWRYFVLILYNVTPCQPSVTSLRVSPLWRHSVAALCDATLYESSVTCRGANARPVVAASRAITSTWWRCWSTAVSSCRPTTLVSRRWCRRRARAAPRWSTTCWRWASTWTASTISAARPRSTRSARAARRWCEACCGEAAAARGCWTTRAG